MSEHGRQGEHGDYDEPVTITDKRRIDPNTGDLREEPEPQTSGSAQGEPPWVDPQASDLGNGSGNNGGDNTSQSATNQTDHAGHSEVHDKVAELTQDLQRAHADFANYRKRIDRDRTVVIDNAKAAVIKELLVVLDDLERAQQHGDLDNSPLKSVAEKLVSVLQAQGLEKFGTQGDPFDPAIHEAVQQEGEGNNPVVSTVYRQGYKLGDKVLRTATVVVGD